MPVKSYRPVFLLLSFLTLAAIKAQPNTSVLPLQGDFEKALDLYDEGQYSNAQQLFDKVVRQEYDEDHETRASAAYYAALCAMKLYNRDARSRIEEFAQTYELSPLKNKLFLEYANFRFSTKQYRDAAGYYDKVDKFRLADEDVNEYLFKRSYAKMKHQELEEAKKGFFELKSRNSTYANSSRYYYAHLLYTEENYAEALTNFLPLQDDQSFGPLVPYYLAHIYYKLEDYDKLLEVGEDLVEKATPTRAPEIAKLVGDAFYNKADYANAVKYFELYREKGGKMNQENHFQLGYSHYKTGNYNAAIGSFNKISGGKENLKQNAYYHLGDCYLKTGNKQQAMIAFKAASEISASPSVQEDAFFNYAKLAYEVSGPYEDGISVLNDFLDRFPRSPYVNQVNRYLANLYVTSKDYDKAMLAIERTGLDSPEMREIYQKVAFYRATQIFNSLKYVEALKKYDESLKYPLNKTLVALAHYWKGESYYRLGEYDKALEQFTDFREVPGAFNMIEYNRSFYQTGYCYFKKFDFQKAAEDLRAFTRGAKQSDPRLPDAYLRLADSYLLTGGYLVAAGFYKDAVKLGSRASDYALFQRAECLGLAGKKQQKIGELENLVRKYPKSTYAADARFEIASTRMQLENYKQAISDFQSFMQEHPQSTLVPAANLQIGLAYGNTDRNNEALTTYKEVVRDYPGTDESLEAIGLARLIYARQNRINDYLDWVETLDFVNFDKSTLDSTAFNSAFDLYSSDQCEEAISAFSSYLKRFAKGIFAVKANYYLSNCARRLNRVQLAKTSYENILEFPRNEYTEEAVEQLAVYADKAGDKSKARKYYRQLAGLAEKENKKLKANQGIMRTSFDLGDYSEAAIYAEVVLSSDLPQEERVEAHRIAAISNLESEKQEAALELFKKLSAENNGEIKAEALYYHASILNQKEQFDTSNSIIYKLIEELPSFKEWKMRALLLMADNFWKTGDIFQANYTLDFVIKSKFNAEITQKAENLKEEIKRNQEQAELLRQQKLEEKSEPVILDADQGLLLIDEVDEEITELPDSLDLK